jgi:hypothetical protein
LTDRAVFQPGTTDVTIREELLDGEPVELGATWPEAGAGPETAAGTPETGTAQPVNTSTAAAQMILSVFRRMTFGQNGRHPGRELPSSVPASRGQAHEGVS